MIATSFWWKLPSTFVSSLREKKVEPYWVFSGTSLFDFLLVQHAGKLVCTSMYQFGRQSDFCFEKKKKNIQENSLVQWILILMNRAQSASSGGRNVETGRKTAVFAIEDRKLGQYFFFCIIAQDTTIRSFIIFLDPGNYKDETLCLIRLQTGGDTTDLPSVPGVLSQVKYCGKLLYSVLSFLLQEKEETFGGFSFSLPLSQESFASVLSRASVEKSNERW